MKKKESIVSASPYKGLKTTAKEIGKSRVKVSKTAKVLKITAKAKGGVRAKITKTAGELKTTAREIGKTRVKVANIAEGLKTATEGMQTKAELTKGIAILKTTAKRKEKVRIKVAKGAAELKTTAKKKEIVRIKVAKGAAKLKTSARKKEEVRVKVARGAVVLKATAKEKEVVRFKLAEIARQLAKTAREKEEARSKLAIIAKQLAKTATEKEEVRIKLAKTAAELRRTAREKEETRIQLAKTAAIIKELSDRNEAILSSIGDGAYACDRQGKIILFNKMAEEITGITKKDALGKHFSWVTNFVNEKTGKQSHDFISQAIRTKMKTGMESDTLLVRKDGKKIPVADTAAPIFDSSGEVTGCIVVFRDVTKERSIDRAKTELVSLSSHQLRSPLTAIGWFAELLESKTNGVLTEKQLKLTKEIRDAHKRMTTLINSLLNVSRIEMGTFAVEPKSTDIGLIVKATLELFRHQIFEKKLTLLENYDKNLDNFRADPKILGVIFQNLISNAVKYTPVGGKIEINIKKQKSLEISVSDTGVGIPKYQQPKIFSKLFRADNANNIDPSGTGLGLYIVSEIVKASGGTIRFESEEGKGSTFYVSYPLSGMTGKKGEKSLT